MKIVQKKGPFSKGASFRVGGSSINEYVHIGISVPWRQPLSPTWIDRLADTNISDKATADIRSRVEEYAATEKYPTEGLNKYETDYPSDMIQDRYKYESLLDHSPSADADLEILTNNNASRFYINRTGILEFDVDVGTMAQITFLRDMPVETVIDLMYDDSV